MKGRAQDQREPHAGGRPVSDAGWRRKLAEACERRDIWKARYKSISRREEVRHAIRLEAKLSQATERIIKLEMALKLARPWVESMAESFGRDPEAVRFLGKLDAALSAQPRSESKETK